MVKYAIKRILIIIPIVLAIIFVIFALLYILPGSQIRHMPIYGGGDALDSVFAFFDAGNNLLTKYIRYCYNAFIRFDFGESSQASGVVEMLLPRARTTLILLAGSVAALTVVGIPIGVYTAIYEDSPADRIINIVSLVFSSIPSYSMALVIALVFVLYLRVLPMMNQLSSPLAYIMPTLTISLGGIASIARMTRACMIETLEQPYISALIAKGLKEPAIFYRHALKNALIPVISSLGGIISQLICGMFVVEYFFNTPGLGFVMLRSVSTRQHVETLGCVAAMTLILASVNIVIDILTAFINPQIRLQYIRKRGVKHIRS